MSMLVDTGDLENFGVQENADNVGYRLARIVSVGTGPDKTVGMCWVV